MSSVLISEDSTDLFWDEVSKPGAIERVSIDRLNELANLAGEYGTAMEANVQAALGHLHTSISWTQVTMLGVLAAVFSKDLIGDGMLQGAAVGMVWVLITNFAVRSAKNYVNIIRFNLLRRTSLEFSAGLRVFPEEKHRYFRCWAHAVRDYHVSWFCPLSRWTIIRKVLFEFGFATAYLVVLFLSARLLWITRPSDWLKVIIAPIGLVAALAEMAHFIFRSPYLKYVRSDVRLERQA